MSTTHESLQSDITTATGRRRGRGRFLVAAILAPVAFGAGGAAVGAGAVGAGGTDPSPCAVQGITSADAAERQVQKCLDDIEAEYTRCMLDAPGTADSLERWVEHCRAEAG